MLLRTSTYNCFNRYLVCSTSGKVVSCQSLLTVVIRTTQRGNTLDQCWYFMLYYQHHYSYLLLLMRMITPHRIININHNNDLLANRDCGSVKAMGADFAFSNF